MAEQATILYQDQVIKEEETRSMDSGSRDLEFHLKVWMVEMTLGTRESALHSNHDWTEAMTKAGIKQDIQDAIMREEYDNIHGTQSLSSWLDEIFETAAATSWTHEISQELRVTVSRKLHRRSYRPDVLGEIGS